MADIFKAGEIVDIAIQIERNGYAFYKELSKTSRNFPVQEAFGLMAAEEKEHIAAFEKLSEKSGAFAPPESYPGEYMLYLKAFAGQNIFTKEKQGSAAADKVSSDAEAIDMAVGFEKDSIIFYYDMKKFIPREEEGVIDSLIDEEKKHLERLLRLRKS